MHVLSVVIGSALLLSACGGGGSDTDAAAASATTVAVETTVAATDLVKNRPLNNCVSVFSGGRPSTSKPLTRAEQIAQREAEIAARPPECRPKGR
jgi:hypothetical protein